MSNLIVNQAGAVAYSVDEHGEIRILLVRSRKNPLHWVLPKGHMEEGEKEEQTAQRELLEEAGISGNLICYAGARQFKFKGRIFRVSYYVFRFNKVVHGGEEGRTPQWCTIDEAVNLIAFSDMKELVKGSFALISKREKAGDTKKL